MIPKKLFKVVILLVVHLLMLSGCWDKKEVEQQEYVIAIGLDPSKEEGKIRVTYLHGNPEVGSQQGGGGSNEPASELITIEATDFIVSRNIANTVISKQLSYDLLSVIIVSEKLARDKEFIRTIYTATKDREIRRDTLLIVSKEEASKFLEKNDPKLETRPHKYFELMTRRVIETGMVPNSDLHRYFRITEGDADLYLAMYATTERTEEEGEGNDDEFLAGELHTEGDANKTQFLGSAVFKEGKMIGKITGEETRIALFLDPTAKMEDVLTTYKDPFIENYRIASRVIKNKSNKVNLDLKGPKPKIDVTIPLTIEILSNPSMVDYAKDNEKKKQLKEHIEAGLEKIINQFIEKTQKEFRGEPFYWSSYVRKKFSNVWEYQQYDWMESYKDAEVHIKADVRFGEFGKQQMQPKLNEVRD